MPVPQQLGAKAYKAHSAGCMLMADKGRLGIVISLA